VRRPLLHVIEVEGDQRDPHAGQDPAHRGEVDVVHVAGDGQGEHEADDYQESAETVSDRSSPSLGRDAAGSRSLSASELFIGLSLHEHPAVPLEVLHAVQAAVARPPLDP
jgi:hypothetical protein